MALIEWSSELSVGIDSIDEQHKKLVGLINSLNKAIADGETQSVLAGIFDGLTDYTRVHFAYEEKLFEEYGYPDSLEHRKQHNALVEQVVELKSRFESDPTNTVSLELMQFLKLWLTTHILKSDKAYAAHLQQKGVK